MVGRPSTGSLDVNDGVGFERLTSQKILALVSSLFTLDSSTKGQTERKNKMSTYNGWTNFATWRVNLECFDGWDLYGAFGDFEWKEILNLKLKIAVEKTEDLKEREFWFKSEMIQYVEEYMKSYPEMMLENEPDSCEVIAGWARAFLDEVNWREVAEHHLDLDAMYNQALLNVKEGAEVIL